MSAFTLIEEDAPDHNGLARFTVIGVGGAGGNAVNNMLKAGIRGVDFVCANTDKQALDNMSALTSLQLGAASTRGLGAGAKPEVGKLAAEEAEGQIREILSGADMVFVTAGMGGGTGTGAAPVIAKIARDMDILTVGVVTTPFRFEGNRRARAAEKGIEELSAHVDSLIIIPNEKLLTVFGDITQVEAYARADNVLLTAVRSIFDMIINHGHINLDFADLKTAMSNRGYAMMGIGSGRGDERAQQAAELAIRSPLLDNILVKDAKGILVNITAGEDVRMSEINKVLEIVGTISDLDEGDIFFGTVINPSLKDELHVTVIATGLLRNEEAVLAAQIAQRAAAQAAQEKYAPPPEDDVPAYQRRATSVSIPVDGTPAPSIEKEKPLVNFTEFLNRQQLK